MTLKLSDKVWRPLAYFFMTDRKQVNFYEYSLLSLFKICPDVDLLCCQDMYDSVYSALKEELIVRGLVIPDSYNIISDWEGAEVSLI